MSAFTIGDFTTDLSGVVNSLNGIAEKLNQCDPDIEIDNTPGKTAVCSVPIVSGSVCATAIKERFTVAGLIETVEGLRDWVRDVESKLGGYDPATPLDAGAWPPSDESTNA
ncbi:MAG: hypothetical protein ABIE42_00960 [Candidatus Eisenbacteria bacterium]